MALASFIGCHNSVTQLLSSIKRKTDRISPIPAEYKPFVGDDRPIVSFSERVHLPVPCQFFSSVFTFLLLVDWVLKCLFLPPSGLLEIANLGLGDG
jgi:hypothetical protein